MKHISSLIIIVLFLTLINSCKQKSFPPAAADKTTEDNISSALPRPAWADAVLHDPEVWGSWDDTSRYNSIVTSIIADERHPEILADIIPEISEERLFLIESVLQSLAFEEPRAVYVELAQSLEKRAVLLGTEYDAVMVYELYNYDEVSGLMIPHLLDENVGTITRCAAARWLRGAWLRDPFPDALQEIRSDLDDALDSIEKNLPEMVSNPKVCEPPLILFHELLLSMKTLDLVDSDEAIRRLDAVEYSFPAITRDGRTDEIRKACEADR